MNNKEFEKKLATKQLSLGNYEMIKIICINNYQSGDGNKIWLKENEYYLYSKAGELGPCHFYDIDGEYLFNFGVDFFIKHFMLVGEFREKRINEILEK